MTGWILIVGFVLVVVALHQIGTVLREIRSILTDLEHRVYEATGGADAHFDHEPD